MLGRNRLLDPGDGAATAIDTGEREELAAGLVLRAVGYRGVPIPRVPFDDRADLVPNVEGRVLGGDREYVAGWIKRGPSGIIGTNKKCATDTVHTLLADLASTPGVHPAGRRRPRGDRGVAAATAAGPRRSRRLDRDRHCRAARRGTPGPPAGQGVHLARVARDRPNGPGLIAGTTRQPIVLAQG